MFQIFHSSEHNNVFSGLQLLQQIYKRQENVSSTATISETKDSTACTAQA